MKIVAIIENEIVKSINKYPYLDDISEIQNNFIQGTKLVEVDKNIVLKEGYTLRHDEEKGFYYEEIINIINNTSPQPTNAEVMQAISDLQADLIIAGVI
jgi:hypothetical protein